jgi:hypothetical protein
MAVYTIELLHGSDHNSAMARTLTTTTTTTTAAAAAEAADADAAPKIDWPTSDGRRLLYADLVEGRYQNMKPKAIYKSRPEFQKWPLKNFRSNYYTARDATAAGLKNAAVATAAFHHDCDMLVAKRGDHFYYPGSSVQTSLREDVKNKTLMKMTPAAIKATRQEYSVVSGEKFRNHLHQEKKRHQKKLRTAEFTDRMNFITARIGERRQADP